MWDAAYKTIREINLLIEGLPKYKSGFSDSDYNTVLGEAYFIRAYVYFAMVKRLGGVPKIDYVIDYPANATLEDTWTPRASEEECWDFIGQDLDLAIAGLPDKNDSGRATRYAAAALKSRAMLYAGSPSTTPSAKNTSENASAAFLPNGPLIILKRLTKPRRLWTRAVIRSTRPNGLPVIATLRPRTSLRCSSTKAAPTPRPSSPAITRRNS